MDQINLDEYNLFNDSKATLKETSADTRDNATTEYMVYSEMEVINFDVVKTKYMNSLSASEECAKSCDALAQINNDIIFIEFKNGSMKTKKKNVRDKIRDSLLIFGDITGKTLSYTRKNLVFVLVYNPEQNPPEKPSLNRIIDNINQRAATETIRFELGKLKGVYFRDIHTYTPEEFERNYLT